MEDHRRTRSQGLPEGAQLIQWDSLQDPVRIEREQTEARRRMREENTVVNMNERVVENNEISQVTEGKPRVTDEAPQLGEISPKQQGQEGHTNVMPKSGEISPKRRIEDNPRHVIENNILPKEPDEVTDLMAMEEGERAQTPDKNIYSNSKEENGPQGEENIQQKSPQIDTAQHFLDDNFSDVMRSSAQGSNVSSLFSTTTFTNTHSEERVTLDWILLDGKNSKLETLRDKHIADFPAPGGNTGAMLVYLPDLEPFYNTKEFLVDLQSGELFVKLNGKWHLSGLACEKRNFEVDGLMALIQHASIRLKNKIYGRKEEQMAVLTLDPTEAQPPPLPFIPNVANYMLHSKPMSPVMRKNYIKDRAQAAVMYITEYGNTTLWSLENLVPLHKLMQCLQVVFDRVDAVRKAVDEVIENDDEIRRKKCMRYLKPPKRFPIPEEMDSEETAMWINWIHMETQALLEDLNEEIKLQNTADDPFTKHIVYAPTQLTQKPMKFHENQEPIRKQKANSEIPPSRHEWQTEEKLASPLPTENMSKPLPQRTNNPRGEIPPTTRDVRSKPSTYTTGVGNTRRQINYDNMNWDGNNTSYVPLPSGRQQNNS